MRIRIALLLTTAMAIGGSRIASAQPDDEVLSIHVSTAGLNLSTEAGAQQLLVRLSAAANRVCGGRPDLAPIHMRAFAAFKACRAQALAQAVAQADSPVLQRQFAATPEAKTLRIAKN